MKSEGNKKVEIPRFIKVKGCINCEASKHYKEKHGTDYGFDHEVQVLCLLSGCMDYGFQLAKPFYDPDEMIRLTKEKRPDLLPQAEKYAMDIRTRFHQFYV